MIKKNHTIIYVDNESFFVKKIILISADTGGFSKDKVPSLIKKH